MAKRKRRNFWRSDYIGGCLCGLFKSERMLGDSTDRVDGGIQFDALKHRFFRGGTLYTLSCQLWVMLVGPRLLIAVVKLGSAAA